MWFDVDEGYLWFESDKDYVWPIQIRAMRSLNQMRTECCLTQIKAIGCLYVQGYVCPFQMKAICGLNQLRTKCCL